MALSVTTAAVARRLTRKEAVKAELGITASTDDALLDDLIDRASQAIVSYCHRPFAREVYTETLSGFGDIHLQLARTPIVAVSSVTDTNSATITDYSVADADRGWLYRRLGWLWTVQAYPGLSAGGRFLDYGSPLPRQEEPLYSVSYTAGYLLPPQNRLGGTISAADADNSFNDSASLMPSLLQAGDIVEGYGFTNAANNARFTVVSRTDAKVVVSGGTLVTEAAGAGKYLLVSSLPADVEKAAIEATKTWYMSRKDDSRAVEKQLGPARVRYEEDLAGSKGLPPLCVGLLRPWVRAA